MQRAGELDWRVWWRGCWRVWELVASLPTVHSIIVSIVGVVAKATQSDDKLLKRNEFQCIGISIILSPCLRGGILLVPNKPLGPSHNITLICSFSWVRTVPGYNKILLLSLTLIQYFYWWKAGIAREKKEHLPGWGFRRRRISPSLTAIILKARFLASFFFLAVASTVTSFTVITCWNFRLFGGPDAPSLHCTNLTVGSS